MTDRPQGPGWYDDPQDANAQRFWDGQNWTPHRQRKPVARQTQVPVKATPPPLPPPPPSNLPPPPPTQAQPPAAPRVESGGSKVGFVIAGVALLLVIAALVAGRVLLGTFLPGLLLVAAIAIIIAVTVAVRSGQSVARKATLISATVLVVALAVPASLKVVYPVYHHFFNDGSSQASRDESPQASPPFDSPSSQASRDESPQASPSFGTQPSHSSTAPSSAPTGSPNAGSTPPDPNFKIVVNGQDVTQDIVQFNRHGASSVTSCRGLTNGTGRVEADVNNAFVLSHGAVTHVYIVDELTNNTPGSSTGSWAFNPDPPMPSPGDAQLTHTGNVYTVTGHVSVIQARSVRGLVPFEWDVTC
jgi:hypothetical protein